MKHTHPRQKPLHLGTILQDTQSSQCLESQRRTVSPFYTQRECLSQGHDFQVTLHYAGHKLFLVPSLSSCRSRSGIQAYNNKVSGRQYCFVLFFFPHSFWPLPLLSPCICKPLSHLSLTKKYFLNSMLSGILHQFPTLAQKHLKPSWEHLVFQLLIAV